MSPTKWVSVATVAYNIQKRAEVVSTAERTSLCFVMVCGFGTKTYGCCIANLVSAAHSATVFELLDDSALIIYRSETMGKGKFKEAEDDEHNDTVASPPRGEQ